jgi:predicted nuclease of predicted toxin-antitoxin system
VDWPPNTSVNWEWRAPDTAILEAGRNADAVVVTLDADFPALLAASQELRPSVIRVRMEGLRATALAEIIEKVALVADVDLNQGPP